MRSTCLLFICTAFIIFSCSDDDNVTPDPRLSLTGSYSITDIDVEVTQGIIQNNFLYTSSSIIELEIDPVLHDDRMVIELEDFLEESLTDYYGYYGSNVNIQVTFLEPQHATIAERSFSVRNLDFEFVVYFNSSGQDQFWNAEVSIEGLVTDSDVTLNYRLVGRESNKTTTFEGTATGVLLE